MLDLDEKGGCMARRRWVVEEIITKLREAEVGLAQVETVAVVRRHLGVTEQTFYRWRREYGGLRMDQAKRLKQLEVENTRLRRAVSDLTLDNQVLKEVAGETCKPFPTTPVGRTSLPSVSHIGAASL